MARWTAPLSNDGVFIKVSFFEAEISSDVENHHVPLKQIHGVTFFFGPAKTPSSGQEDGAIIPD